MDHLNLIIFTICVIWEFCNGLYKVIKALSSIKRSVKHNYV